jgi:DNA polymerase-3 subunit delta
MIYVLYGADDYAIHQELETIKQQLGDAENLSSNTIRMEGSRLTPSELKLAVESLPFFGDKRLVLLKGLLGRFEKGNKTGTVKGAGKDNSGLAEFVPVLKSAPPSTVAILIEGALKKATPLLKELAGVAEIRQFAPLAQHRVPGWIKQYAKKLEAAISDDAAAKLAELVGPNMWTLSSELEKLTLMASGRVIGLADVLQAVAASREAGIFEMVDAVVEGRVCDAQTLLQALLRDGESPGRILSMIARQLRLIVRAKSLQEEGHPGSYIQTRLSLQDFAMRRTLVQANRFDFTILKRLYRQMLETDMAIKTSRYDEELAVTLMVTETCLCR